MSSKKPLWAHAVLLRSQDVIGRQEGSIPKNRMGKVKADRRKRKPGLAEVIPLRAKPKEWQDYRTHGDCEGCQLCIVGRCELAYGGKWRINGRGTPERIEE